MKTPAKALITSTMLVIAAPSAWAVEPQEFMDRLVALSANTGSDIQYGAIEGDANAFTVSNVVMDPKSKDFDGGIPLGNLTVMNIRDAENGLYTADKIIVEDFDTTNENLNVIANGMSLSKIELPQPSGTSFVFYENLTVNNVEVSFKGAKWFTMRDLVSVQDANPERTNISVDFDIAALTLNLGEMVDGRTKAILGEMGYTTLNGTSGLNMNWNGNSGLTVIEDYFLDVDDVGQLTTNLTIDGYTLEIAKSIGELSQNDDQNAAGIAMMGLMQQLNFVSASIKFEDKSFTGKVLDYQAAKQGTDRAALVGMAKAIIPFSMAQLNKPEFTQQVAAAVGSFLENPKSIEIIARPPEPVPFFELAASGSSQPQNLIDVLELDVKANQ